MECYHVRMAWPRLFSAGSLGQVPSVATLAQAPSAPEAPRAAAVTPDAAVTYKDWRTAAVYGAVPARRSTRRAATCAGRDCRTATCALT